MLVPSSFFNHWCDHWLDAAARYVPKAGIAEREQEYVLSLDLPGFKKSELQVEVEDNHLLIKGERRPEDGGNVREERAFGAFECRYVLPQSVARQKIAVTYRDGVLRLTLPKRAEAKAQRLTIDG